MSTYNSVLLVGNLGRDPELRRTRSGSAVAELSIATTYKYKKIEETEWHAVIAWDRYGENCQKFLKKGDKVLIRGRLKTEVWGEGDNRKCKTKIVAAEIRLLSRKSSGTHEVEITPSSQGSQDDQPREGWNIMDKFPDGGVL